MLFLALLSYLLLFPAICLILGVLWPEVSGMILAVPTGIASLLLAAKLGRVAEIYAPGLKRPLRLLARREGIRWLCALTVIAFAGAMVWQIAFHGRLHDGLPIGIAIPAVVVFGLNWIGIELPVRGLEAETKPDLVNIPPPPEGPAQPDSPMSPETAPPVTPSPLQPAAKPGGAPAPEAPLVAPPAGWALKPFHWSYKGTNYTTRLAMSEAEYQQRRQKPRVLDTTAWPAEYVSQGISPEIRDLAAQLYRLGHPFGSQDEVAFVLAFVQQVITYRSEEGEYPRYPVETLWEGGGDCEDYSILGAAILLSMGYQVALLLLPRHAALGVAGADGLPGVYAEREGVRYFYCEMTGESWRFGELPPDLRNESINVAPVPPPTLKIVRPATERQQAV